MLLSGIDAEYFFSDVLDKACGHNSPFKMRDIPAIAPFPPPSGTASDRFMSLWEVENDSSSDTSNEKRRLLRAIEQRLEECVLSQQPMDHRTDTTYYNPKPKEIYDDAMQKGYRIYSWNRRRGSH